MKINSPARWLEKPGWGQLLLPGLVILALFLYMTGLGFGGTSDSGHYLWAAHTMRTTGRLLAPNGTLYRFWGPLYPLLLAAFYSPGAVRVLHGGALLAQVVLWGQVGRWLLPAGRAAALPWLVALSTAVLVPSKFIWSETVFGALAAAYVVALLAWGRGGRLGWLALATGVGFLLPLQRTSGFFVLAGVGVGCLLTGQWRGRWRALAGHWVLCAAGGLAWSYYAELVAGPPTYQTVRAWSALGSMADYGYVLARWFVPLGASWRTFQPAFWALLLPLLLGLLWPGAGQAGSRAAGPASAPWLLRLSNLRLLWWLVLATLVALLLATKATRAARGLHDVERYCAVLVGPVLLLALARWPGAVQPGVPRAASRWRWVGRALLAGWLGYSAVRVGHNAQALRQRPPMAWPAGSSAANYSGYPDSVLSGRCGRAAFLPPARFPSERQPGGQQKSRPPGTYTNRENALSC